MGKSLALAVLVLVAACGSHKAEQESVDTSLVFVPAPPGFPSRDQMNSLMTALNAYSKKQISADSAAKVIVDHMRSTRRSLNMPMDPALQAAVARELKKHPL
jgi:hypothetical protein